MKFCAYCGAKLEDDARFCLICGEKCIDFLDENEEPSLEEEKLEEEKKAKEEAERLEQERLAEEARLKAEEEARLEAERLAKEEEERKAKEEAERLEQERLEQERLEQERLEQERLEQERLEQERLEAERLEQERLAKEEEERLEQERLAELQKKEEESKKVSELEEEIASLKAQLQAAQQNKNSQEIYEEGVLLDEPPKEEPLLEEPPKDENSLEETSIEDKKENNFVLPIVALAVSLLSAVAYLLIKDLFNLSIIVFGVSVALVLFTLISSFVFLGNRKMSKDTKWICIINILCCVGMVALLIISLTGTLPGGGK